MTVNSKKKLLNGLSICLFVSILAARPHYFSLVQSARTADLIVVGSILEQQGNLIRLKIKTVLKGGPVDSSVSITVTDPARVGAVFVINTGTDVVISAKRYGSEWQALPTTLDSIIGEPTTLAARERALRAVMDYDNASTPESRTSVLLRMIEDVNTQPQSAALEIIYLEGPVAKFQIQPLLQPLLRLTGSSDTSIAINATQALGRIGDRSVILPLIQLMGTSNTNVAQVAYRSFKNLCGVEFDFPASGDDSVEVRSKIVLQWRNWWEQNKNTLRIIH